MSRIDAALDDDIARVASMLEDAPPFEVQINIGAEATWITVRPSQNVHRAITEAFGGREDLLKVFFASNDVLSDASFDDHGIEVRAARCVAVGGLVVFSTLGRRMVLLWSLIECTCAVVTLLAGRRPTRSAVG